MGNTSTSKALTISLVLAGACDPGGSPEPSGVSAATEAEGSASATTSDPTDATTGGTDDGDTTHGGGADSGDTTGTSAADSSGGTPELPMPPSCDGLETQCAGESCCVIVPVDGGDAMVGRSQAGADSCPSGFACFSEEVPEHAVTLDGFALDKYAVTVGRFRKFVAAWNDNWHPMPGQGAHPSIPGTGWFDSWNAQIPGGLETNLTTCPNATYTAEPGLGDDRPITCLTWYEAQAFCIWDGGRLATEAEWEWVAAGGAENRLFPWGGADIDDTRLVIDAGSPQPVGTKPAGAGRYGHMDLAGNADEWVYDCWQQYFFETPEASVDNAALLPIDGPVPCVEPSETTDADPRVVKGGGASTKFDTYARVTGRDAESGRARSGGRTMRCAYDL